MVSLVKGTENREHVVVFTTIFLFLIAMFNFIPFLVIFLKSNFLWIVYAYIFLPLPLMAANSIDQANVFTNSATGMYNTNIQPTGTMLLNCFDPIRQLINAIIGIGRSMIHAVAINFYPITRIRVFGILKNILFFAINFATIIWTMLLNLLTTILTDWANNNFSFSGTLTAVKIIIDFIMSVLLDVLDPDMCFHPLSQEPGRLIQCLSNGRLNATDVNNEGFIGYLKSIVIIACGIGKLNDNFITDILLPCTGLDQFFVVKEYWVNIYGNATVFFKNQQDRFDNQLAQFKYLSTRIANAGPQIVSYIIRKICGGVAFFCKILKGLGIPSSKMSTPLNGTHSFFNGQHLIHEDFNSKVHWVGKDAIADGISGVCVYKGNSDQGELVGCYYSAAPVIIVTNPDGTMFDIDAMIDRSSQRISSFNSIMSNFYSSYNQLQGVQDTMIYHPENQTSIVTNTINNFFLSNGTASIVPHNAMTQRIMINPPPNKPFTKGVFMKERIEHHYNIASARLAETLHFAPNYTSSAFYTLLTCTKHFSKAMSVGMDTFINYRKINNHYMYSRNSLKEIGFDFGEVMDSVMDHGAVFHPHFQPQGFTMDLNMNGVIASLIFTGISGVVSAVGFIITLLIGMITFPVYMIGATGVLMNSMQNTTTHFDLGFNAVLTPFANWTSFAIHQEVPKQDASNIVVSVMSKLPVVAELCVLEVVRFGVLCNFPFPLGPFSCPPQIPMTINEDTILFDTTLDYIINITFCEPIDCVSSDPDMYGVPCIGGVYNCWGYIPKLDFPIINAGITPNTKECLYNGTRFTDHLSWYNYPINWLKYTWTDGLQFAVRTAYKGYYIPFLVIPGSFLLGKICACLSFPLKILMWIAIIQYPVRVFHYIPPLCSEGALFGLCDRLHDYVLFPSGDFDSDDIYCTIVGWPVYYYGILITVVVVALFLTLFLVGWFGSIIRDIISIAFNSVHFLDWLKKKFTVKRKIRSIKLKKN